ncbi:hypothetical protein, partial [Pseudonocardia sulfidoxydans]
RCSAWLSTRVGPPRESLRVPAKELVERRHEMALDQSALLEVLDAFKAADVGDRVRQAADNGLAGLERNPEALLRLADPA